MTRTVSSASQACDSDQNGLRLRHCDAIQSEGRSCISVGFEFIRILLVLGYVLKPLFLLIYLSLMVKLVIFLVLKMVLNS